jgi:ribosome-associated protein
MIENIYVKTPVIQLTQLLKWSGISETGGQSKKLIEKRSIFLNGVLVIEKRKKICVGDQLRICDKEYFIVSDDCE